MSGNRAHRKHPRGGEPPRAPRTKWWLGVVLLVVVLIVGLAVVVKLADAADPQTDGARPPAGAATNEGSRGRPGAGRLSDGCALSPRGVPLCSGLLGAAYGSNADPTVWERRLGQPLGVRRTYYAPDRVPQAIGDVRANLRAGRMSWISFKLPYSWADMAAGRGDDWVRDLATRLATVDGPVWLAFHHEPENDGPMADWTHMQQRLSPMVRRLAPNVAYTIILTGWNQIYGPPWLSFDALWPRDTVIDLVGFDVYNDFGVVRDGETDLSATALAKEYFVHFEEFSKTYGVPWGLAETGVTDAYSQRNPQWMQQTYRELVEHDGVALVYFNSRLNSRASWRLLGAKEQDFADALADSPMLTLPHGRSDGDSPPRAVRARPQRAVDRRAPISGRDGARSVG